MTLAEARAIVGARESLIVRSQNSDADRAALESLAVWADRFSPCVHLEGDDSLLLDMSGSQRLFPDEPGLLQQMVENLRDIGYTARASLADTAGAAWALAHAHPADTIIAPPGRTAATLAHLPVAALRIDQHTVTALHTLGVETVEALLYLPRSSLGSRFGDNLLYRLDQALGDAPELLIPFRPKPVLKSRLCIGRPTDRYDILAEALDRVLTSFCDHLDRRVAGVRQMFVTFEHPAEQRRRPITLQLNTSQATRSVKHLRSLLAPKLDELQKRARADADHDRPAGIAAVMLWTRHVEPLDGRQEELFDTGQADAESLSHLIDRLTSRLGPQAIVRPHPQDDHQPEQAVKYTPIIRQATKNATYVSSNTPVLTSNFSLPISQFSVFNSQFPARPLRLLSRPIEVPVLAAVPEGPPSCFDWSGSREMVVGCAGPERVETGWWRGRHVRRDYFRVVCQSGRRCWLFRQRETGKWFLHGWFD